MGIKDEAEHIAEEVAGKAKEILGDLTNNEAPMVEGEAEFEQARDDLQKDQEKPGQE